MSECFQQAERHPTLPQPLVAPIKPAMTLYEAEIRRLQVGVMQEC